MIEQIYEEPTHTEWFQKALDSMCAGRGVQLRIVWAPKRTVAKVVDKNGKKRIYSKYPVLFANFAPFVKGKHFWRKVNGDLIQIAYQKTEDAIIPPNVQLTDIATPDIEYINPSVHLFMVEKRLPDEKAKQIHEEKRGLAKQNLGFDLFGEFPKEGVWDCIMEISRHEHVNTSLTCCDVAAQYDVRCMGLYRAPNRKDLRRIEKWLQEYEARPNVRDKSLLIAQAAKDEVEAITNYEIAELTKLLEEARECEELDVVAHERTRVVMGVNAPRHRSAY